MQRNTKEQRPGVLNPTQKMTVRLALATGATVVVLMGAQTLALFDQNWQTNTNTNNAVIQQDQSNTNSDNNTLDFSNGDDSSAYNSQQSTYYDQSQNYSIQSAPFQPRVRSRSSR